MMGGCCSCKKAKREEPRGISSIRVIDSVETDEFYTATDSSHVSDHEPMSDEEDSPARRAEEEFDRHHSEWIKADSDVARNDFDKFDMFNNVDWSNAIVAYLLNITNMAKVHSGAEVSFEPVVQPGTIEYSVSIPVPWCIRPFTNNMSHIHTRERLFIDTTRRRMYLNTVLPVGTMNCVYMEHREWEGVETSTQVSTHVCIIYPPYVPDWVLNYAIDQVKEGKRKNQDLELKTLRDVSDAELAAHLDKSEIPTGSTLSALLFPVHQHHV